MRWSLQVCGAWAGLGSPLMPPPHPCPQALCGNFNQNQAEHDFGPWRCGGGHSRAAFANTWKTQAACPQR